MCLKIARAFQFIAVIFLLQLGWTHPGKTDKNGGHVDQRTAIYHQHEKSTALPESEVYRVERVVDGDTILLTNGERIRLIGVDTPEFHKSRKLNRDAERTAKDIKTIQSLGFQASSFVKTLLKPDKQPKITLEYDQSNAAKNHRDRYGRTLAYVFFDPTEIGKGITNTSLLSLDSLKKGFLNGLIIEAGYGNTYSKYPFKFRDEFLKYEREARENKRGLWPDQDKN